MLRKVEEKKVSWKNLPYWLKGGIIGIGSLILSYIIFVTTAFLGWYSNILFCGFDSDNGLIKQGLFGTCSFLADYRLYILFNFIILIIELFILGALIGFIVGKIKNRREKRLK